MDDPRPQRPSRAEKKPSKTSHLHVRTVEGLLFEEAIAITGNARALLQLRDRIDRTLGNETSHPFEEAVYRDVNGKEFEVAVKKATSREGTLGRRPVGGRPSGASSEVVARGWG
jgi:hypothetical protein